MSTRPEADQQFFGGVPSEHSTHRITTIEAAGAVCWRVHDKTLQVLLIHRPRYDDWSWPKGKLDPDEHFQNAAVREVEEETGIKVKLGMALPTARYRISEATSKVVRYWAARVADGVHPAPPRPDEVDRTAWVSIQQAEGMLTRRGDRAQLHSVAEHYQDGTLDTWPFLVLRHGHARPRVGWGRDDASRPLVTAGKNQAQDLAALLQAWGPVKVVCSPWIRCVTSVQPYVDAVSGKVRTRGKLTEDGHRRDPKATAALISKQIRKNRAVLVCTHRPVLGTVLGVLAGHASPGISRELPLHDPFLRPGEVLVAHVAHRSGRIVAVERQTSRTG